MRKTTYTVFIGKTRLFSTKNYNLALGVSTILYHCLVPVELLLRC